MNFTRILITLFVLVVAANSSAAVYYVSPSGNDSDNGLAPETAWLTIDNGDWRLHLVSGNTCNTLVGGDMIISSIN